MELSKGSESDEKIANRSSWKNVTSREDSSAQKDARVLGVLESVMVKLEGSKPRKRKMIMKAVTENK